MPQEVYGPEYVNPEDKPKTLQTGDSVEQYDLPEPSWWDKIWNFTKATVSGNYGEAGIIVAGTYVDAIGDDAVSPYDETFLLTKGRYRVYFNNPTFESFDFTQETHYVTVDGKRKQIDILGFDYDYENRKAVVTLDVVDNPIPALLVWGIVLAVATSVGLVLAGSTISKVEKVIDAPAPKLILFGIGATLLVGALASTGLFKKGKK